MTARGAPISHLFQACALVTAEATSTPRSHARRRRGESCRARHLLPYVARVARHAYLRTVERLREQIEAARRMRIAIDFGGPVAHE